jgi:hypothetical protein
MVFICKTGQEFVQNLEYMYTIMKMLIAKIEVLVFKEKS